MEEWTRWEPINGLSGKYSINSLTIAEDKLIIQLSDHDKVKKIEIVFDNGIDGYRYTYESFCFKIFGDLSQKHGIEFYKNWSFFKVTNSEYLQWLSEKSRTWSDQFTFIHFCIFGNDEVVDILARYEPIIKIIE